ncbi:cytochrome P450 [Rhizopogon salebrosus TDB-379]|nr:cytochrome P450 [Rhizopogon salebrosus TDB-379]
MLQLPDLRISDSSLLAFGAAACLGAGVIIIWAFLTKSDSKFPLPPSPPNWRLRGHFLPRRSPVLTVAGWIDEYGPLITIRSGTERIVIIGRHKAAVDIMEKQAGSIVDRPRMVAAGEILSYGESLTFAHVGDRFRRMRRALHAHLQPKAAEEYQPLQMLYAKKMVLNILDDPSNFHNHIMTCAATTIMKVTYGKNTPTAATDSEAIEIRQIMLMFRAAIRSGAYLVDSIPWLKHLPWYGQELRRGGEMFKRLNTNNLNRVRQQIVQSSEDVGPSFARSMLEDGHLYGLTESEMASLAGALFGGGADTVSVAMSVVLMAAACFPDEQAKVQAEFDEVVGRHRVPTFADQSSLPHLQAFIFEALRWRPLVAGALTSGLAHRTNKDVIWENYCIPAGTTVFGNHWAISRDPEVFPEPNEFKPQRWIDDDGHFRDDLKFFVYGFGRRVCPGQHVANRSVFITSVLILWAFQLSLDPTKPLDDMGFINGIHQPCSIEFNTRISETDLRRIMDNHFEVA